LPAEDEGMGFGAEGVDEVEGEAWEERVFHK
jgi:hypothetical protein